MLDGSLIEQAECVALLLLLLLLLLMMILPSLFFQFFDLCNSLHAQCVALPPSLVLLCISFCILLLPLLWQQQLLLLLLSLGAVAVALVLTHRARHFPRIFAPLPADTTS